MKPTLTASNTHGAYATFDPRVVEEMAEVFYGHMQNNTDALRMYCVGVTGVDNWWNGETTIEMFIAIAECGGSAKSLAAFIRAANRDEFFANGVHRHKVDVVGMLCADTRYCMMHHGESIHEDALEMNKRFDEVRAELVIVNKALDWLNERIEKRQSKMRALYNEIDSIHSRV